jgi:hypothetical protein
LEKFRLLNTDADAGMSGILAIPMKDLVYVPNAKVPIGINRINSVGRKAVASGYSAEVYV